MPERREVLTIGIPARNEEQSIGKTLRSILESKLPSHLRTEIIVGANGCTDNTVGAAREFSEKYADALKQKRMSLRIIETPGGKPNAWNAIRREAKGDKIVFADADVLVPSNSIARLYGELSAKPQLKGVSSNIELLRHARPTFFDRFVAIPYKFPPVQVGTTGGLYIVRKDVIEGEMPSHIINEDAWLSLKAGKNVARSPDVKVVTGIPRNLRDFLATHIRIERGHAQLVDEFGEKARSVRRGYDIRLFRYLTLGEAVVLPVLLGLKKVAAIAAKIDSMGAKKKFFWTPTKSSKLTESYAAYKKRHSL